MLGLMLMSMDALLANPVFGFFHLGSVIRSSIFEGQAELAHLASEQ